MIKFKEILLKHYSLQLIIILLLSCIVSWTLKIYVLSGIILFGFTLIVFIRSFKDINFKKKKLITKIFIYFFIAIFFIDGIIFLSGNPDKSANVIRQEMSK